MSSYRQNRLNDALAQEISVLLREVKDPRIAGTMITVTGARVTPDLKYAKVYYSVFGDYDEAELKKGFSSSAGFFRSQIARRMNLRITPEITFCRDTSIEHGAQISSLLREIEASRPPETAAEDGDVTDEDGQEA